MRLTAPRWRALQVGSETGRSRTLLRAHLSFGRGAVYAYLRSDLGKRRRKLSRNRAARLEVAEGASANFNPLSRAWQFIWAGQTAREPPTRLCHG